MSPYPRVPTFVFLAAAAPLPRQAVVVVERRQLNQTQPADLLRVPGADVTDVRQAELVRLRNEMLQQTQVQRLYMGQSIRIVHNIE